MTLPLACILIAFLLIPLTKVPVGVAMARQAKGYDNKHPRDQQAALEGWGKRAVGAHNNTIEAFPGFAAAVLVAHVGGGDPARAAQLSIAFVAARVVYPALYLANLDKARSIVWTVGIVATAWLMLLPALG